MITKSVIFHIWNNSHFQYSPHAVCSYDFILSTVYYILSKRVYHVIFKMFKRVL